MKHSRFSEEQIIGIFKEHAAGLPATELCRKHGISDATFYRSRTIAPNWLSGSGPLRQPTSLNEKPTMH